MNKILTIIIAAYNVEKLLPRCLDSIIIAPEMQKKVQVLVINDGSKDCTMEIAKEYEAKYPGYITAIEQINGNYGKVMNNGLSLAEGKYFRTLDADDWYDTGAYIKFVQMLDGTDADMIITERKTYREDRGCYVDYKINTNRVGEDLLAKEAFSLFSDIEKCLGVWHFTYKTSVLRSSGLNWLEGICYTDTMYDIWPLPFVKTVRFEKLPVYVYIYGVNEQSTSAVNYRRNFAHLCKVAEAVVPYYKKYYKKDASYYMIYRLFLTTLYGLIYNDLLVDYSHLQEISKIHRMLAMIPDFQKEQEERYVMRGCHYLSMLSDGKLPVMFKFWRGLARIKHLFIKQ